MSDHYPAGSMRGSGIFSDEIPVDVSCADDCDYEDRIDVMVDDWGVGHWTCPNGHENEVDVREYDEPDPDDARDRAREDW